MTRIQLETGFIDLPASVDFPIDLSFAEITKQGARSGGYSRQLDIEGTANNTTLLGAYFDIDLSNDTFDRNVKTTCSVIQNGVEVFDGFIQLLEISRINSKRGTNGKLIKYKIFVFDEVSNFFNEMGDKELTALSFPELSHVFNRANIIASWANTSGYTYPQFAKDDAIYTLRDFKPAIYEWEYFKKIFATNGYTFTFAEYNDSAVRLDQRIVPFNGKQGDDTVSQFLKQTYLVRGQQSSASYLLDQANVPTFPFGYIPFMDYLGATAVNTYITEAASVMDLDSIYEDAQSQWSTVNNDLTNLSGQGRNFQIVTKYGYSINVRAKDAANNIVAWEVIGGSGARRCDVKITLVARSKTNNTKFAYIDAGQTSISLVGGETYASGWQSFASGVNNSFANLGVFDSGEKFDVHTLVTARYFNASGTQVGNIPDFISLTPSNLTGTLQVLGLRLVDQATGDPIRLEFDIDLTDLEFKAIPDITELIKGSNVSVDAFIPKKIKQRDLIASISKSYNLIFSPDPENTKNIIIKTRDKYYADGGEWDWTEKLQEAELNTITFLSNEVKKKQVYKYKSDKDTLNSAYQSEFVETYGQTTIDLDNEYTNGTDTTEIIYSPTPSIGSGIGVPLPAINGINPECNVRVLLHNGVGSVSQYVFYDDLVPNANELGTTTDYCYTSMFDNDVTPNFAITYDAPRVLFHAFQTGQTTNYLYTLHHQQELTTINTGRKFTAYFDLSESDYQKLSKRLDWKIFIKDNGWFFVSKVFGYNSNKRTLTKVELITADEKTRIKYRIPFPPLSGTTLSNEPILSAHFDKVSASTNIVLGANVSIDGKYNVVTADNVKIMGDQNTVKSSDALVLGNRNLVEVAGVKVLADDSTPLSTGVQSGGDLVFKAKIVQAGTNNPTLTIIRNDFGGTITTVYNSIGGYSILGFAGQLTGNIETSINYSSLNVGKEVIIVIPTSSVLGILTYASGIQDNNVLNSFITVTKYQ